MHHKTLDVWKHTHDFAVIHEKGERRTFQVLVMTAITMVVEIIAGISFGSMALLADGWHMGTHVAAFMITIFAYRYARKHEITPRFTFGTGKVSVLGGFASAIALFVVALVMAIESIQRLLSPQVIHFNEAIGIAVAGLIINLLCALILQDHHHDHHEETDHDHDHHGHHDHNLKAAYFHVLADALTSVLAILALSLGKFYGWTRLDPVIGIIGALVIARWSWSLVQETSPILLDENTEEEKKLLIREIVESDRDNRVCDLHLWRVGPQDFAAVVSLVTHSPKPVEHYKNLLKHIPRLSHTTIEVYQCTGDECLYPQMENT